jgi:hypothetical protein
LESAEGEFPRGAILGKGNVRNNAVDNNMNANVPNPFFIGNLTPLRDSAPDLYRYLSSQSMFTSNVIRKNVLLRAFPQIGTGTLTGIRPGQDFDSARALNEYKDLRYNWRNGSRAASRRLSCTPGHHTTSRPTTRMSLIRRQWRCRPPTHGRIGSSGAGSMKCLSAKAESG